MSKENEILNYSNPKTVYKNAVVIFGPDVDIRLSTRKNKKYMLLNPHTNHYTHFGQMGFEDYTKHRDNIRRMKFRTRNKKWADQHIYSPAFLSYYLLW
jgi:hypothetical protein